MLVESQITNPYPRKTVFVSNENLQLSTSFQQKFREQGFSHFMHLKKVQPVKRRLPRKMSSLTITRCVVLVYEKNVQKTTTTQRNN